MLASSGQSSGGTNPSNFPPVVTIAATTPIASWSGTPGVFAVFRTGDPSMALNVYCAIGGTASNGVDYQQIGSFVQLASGVMSNTVVITPINNGQSNAETVTLKLASSPLMSPMMPVNYIIGYPDSATVAILPAGETNIPPFVTITSPANGSVFYTPVNIPLIAVAGDLDGYVTSVQFFAGTNSLGIASNWVVVDPLPGGGTPGLSRAFFLVWSNAPAGTNVLTALATDNGGATGVSGPVNITVLSGSNLPPVVRITSPPNGSVFRAPLNLPIFAYAAERDGSIASVEFFAGTNDLGAGNPVTAVPPPLPPGPVQPPILIVEPTNYWELVWTNPPPGTNALTAKATDAAGVSTTSAPVNITILPEVPPPTNFPRVASIVATDPVAIEDTNCWTWLGLAGAPATWSNWVSPTAVCRLFTNCGPQNALFTVYCFGETNKSVTVNYAIGGTATNGVDYVTLPGSVTIPAGQRLGMIPLVPLDDGAPDITSTVVLKLTPSTNSPPDYVLGFPRQAAAIILDGTNRFPRTGMLAGNCFHLTLPGPDGAWFHIDYSTDLLNWSPLCTNQVIAGSIDFLDPDAAGSSSRFYRAVPEAGPPQ
ncbi:MAG TPA: Ig-like domain-containing protein [Candidatus Acidoferrum sp.]|nr:Ig-like domain-containing protein [Candidatus Acidoferrum sp.]